MFVNNIFSNLIILNLIFKTYNKLEILFLYFGNFLIMFSVKCPNKPIHIIHNITQLLNYIFNKYINQAQVKLVILSTVKRYYQNIQNN